MGFISGLCAFNLSLSGGTITGFIRIFAATVALGLTGCVTNVTPLDAVHLPSAEKATLVDAVEGSYCFCSRDQNLDTDKTHEGKIMQVGGIDINRLANASMMYLSFLTPVPAAALL